MQDQTEDQPVLKHIQGLMAEEQQLHEQGGLAAADHERLAKINVELDQCWDLLRQRRALRDAGRNPDQAEVRPADVVERYLSRDIFSSFLVSVLLQSWTEVTCGLVTNCRSTLYCSMSFNASFWPTSSSRFLAIRSGDVVPALHCYVILVPTQ